MDNSQSTDCNVLIRVKGLAEKNKMSFKIKGSGTYRVIDLGHPLNVRMVQSDELFVKIKVTP